MNYVLYCAQSGLAQQLFVSDTVGPKAGPTKGLLVVPADVYAAWQQSRIAGDNSDVVQDFVTSKTGLAPVKQRNVIIDKQTQTYAGATYICCPLCPNPHLALFDFIPHPAADETWPYDAQSKTFTQPASLNPIAKQTQPAVG